MTSSIIRRIRRAGVQVMERLIARSSSVGKGPFFDETRFPWAAEVATGWRDVRAELDAVLEDKASIPLLQDLSPEQAAIAGDDKWRCYYLFAFGRVEENCRRCPATAALLERIPGLTSAFFSILAPGKHIPAHRGPYNGVLRFHLGLRIPAAAGACRIRVGDQTRPWREGEGLFFDDTFLHEAWNESSEDRVVLFVDFRRPLPFPVSLLNRLFLLMQARSRFVRDGRDNLAAWNRRRDGRRS